MVLSYFADKISSMFFSKGHNSGKGHNTVEENNTYQLLFKRNRYKKFQNKGMHLSKVMLCIKKHDEPPDGRTPQKQYAPPTSSKLGA